MFSVFCKRFCCILNKIVKELMYLLIFHPFLKPNFVAIILDQTVYVLCRTGHVQIFQVRSFQELIDLFVNAFTLFLSYSSIIIILSGKYGSIYYSFLSSKFCVELHPTVLELCSIVQKCAELYGISWNCAKCAKFTGLTIKIYLDWNPNQNTLIYSESIYNMQRYEKLAFCN